MNYFPDLKKINKSQTDYVEKSETCINIVLLYYINHSDNSILGKWWSWHPSTFRVIIVVKLNKFCLLNFCFSKAFTSHIGKLQVDWTCHRALLNPTVSCGFIRLTKSYAQINLILSFSPSLDNSCLKCLISELKLVMYALPSQLLSWVDIVTLIPKK